MTINKILVTSQSLYLERFQHLFHAIGKHFDQMDYVPIVDVMRDISYLEKISRKTNYLLYQSTKHKIFAPPIDPLKTPKSFVKRSQWTEQKIRQLNYKPDLIFHVFCLSSPLWQQVDIPYVMLLDYTMALAKQNWSTWAAFRDDAEYSDWLMLERKTYQHAHHLFAISHQVKSSLVEDYQIHPSKITVTGSSANFASIYEGEKYFGSKQMMFNGSDFYRKGGDLVLAALRQVREVIPEVKLVVFGAKLPIEDAGVENPGRIDSREEMQNYLLNTDLVLAPARCDPFPVFPMEAMNFGVPCIVSDCDGNPEIVSDGVDGSIVSKPTPELLAEKIMSLLNDPSLLTTMSLNARHKIKTKLNWGLIGNEVAQTISKININ
jgi:glycosyltransferase involved in cell wall biosynthesis